MFGKYKVVWKFESNALTTDDGRYIKTKKRAYSDKVYTNFLPWMYQKII